MTISISNLHVADNAPFGTTVGVLTATDEAGKIIPCNFILTKKKGGYFAISTDKLITAWGQSIRPDFYSVVVRANGIHSGFSGSAIFTITVTAAVSPPMRLSRRLVLLGSAAAVAGAGAAEARLFNIAGRAAPPPIAIDALSSGLTTANITTTVPNTLLIAIDMINDDEGAIGVSSPNTIGAAGMGTTWHYLTEAFQGIQGCSLWWAVAPSMLSTELVTFTHTLGSGPINFDVVAVRGANTSSPFDPSMPIGVTVTNATTYSFTTSHAYDLLLSFYRWGITSNPTGGGNWTQLLGANYRLLQYQVVSTTQSGLVAPVGNGIGQQNAGIGLAIVAGGAPAPPPPAMRAFDFYSKFGVNGNLDSGGTIANELADMAYIGIKNIRDVIYNIDAADANNWASYLALLSAQGVRQHIALGAATGGVQFNLMADWINALKTYIVLPYGAKMVTGVSGPNEANIQYFGYQNMTGVPAANAAQADLYALMKADPALSSIPVDMWPVALLFNSSTPDTVGDQTAHCDRGNLHDYYAADNYNQPTNPTVGPLPIALQAYLRNSRRVCNRQAFVTTETGWYTPIMAGWLGTGCNEYVQARLLLNDLFDHAMLLDCEAVYLFTLRWGSADFSDPGWGVIYDDGTPKPSGTAIRNLMQIINDTGSEAATFSPGSLSYSLSGMPAASGNFVIAKSNGAFDILLWNETPIWDNSTATQISIPTSTVTVSLPPGSSGSIYNPLQGTAPIATFSTVNQVQVQLNDAPLIIEVQ